MDQILAGLGVRVGAQGGLKIGEHKEPFQISLADAGGSTRGQFFSLSACFPRWKKLV